jgi:hypothetical protein
MQLWAFCCFCGQVSKSHTKFYSHTCFIMPAIQCYNCCKQVYKDSILLRFYTKEGLSSSLACSCKPLSATYMVYGLFSPVVSWQTVVHNPCFTENAVLQFLVHTFGRGKVSAYCRSSSFHGSGCSNDGCLLGFYTAQWLSVPLFWRNIRTFIHYNV